MNNVYAVFERENFPVINITFTGIPANEENFRVYLEELYKNYEACKPLVIVFDASNAPSPSMQYQKQQAQWMKDNEALIKKYCRGIAYVVPNMVLRNVLKLIFGVQQNPVPFKVTATLEEGNKWVNQQLAQPLPNNTNVV